MKVEALTPHVRASDGQLMVLWYLILIVLVLQASLLRPILSCTGWYKISLTATSVGLLPIIIQSYPKKSVSFHRKRKKSVELKNGHYEIALPFKDVQRPVPNNRVQAEQRVI